MLNPPASIHELHITFVLWKKLLGHNNGDFDNYYYQLLEYQNRCSEGMGQLPARRIERGT